MADSQLRKLARDVAELKRFMIRSKQTRLANSTIEGGAIQATDDTGTLTMVVGTQFDGTNTTAVVVGPTPPAPSAPVVTIEAGLLRIYWDGTFVGGSVAPMDFARVLVYAEPASSYTVPDPIDSQYVVGELTSATGSEITAGLSGGVAYKVWFYTWTQAGKFSASSAIIDATPGVMVDEALIAAKSAIYRQPTAPWPNAPGHLDDIGDLWFDTTPTDGPESDVVSWSVASNVVTLTTDDVHGLAPGNPISASGVDVTVDGNYTVIATPTTTTLTYAKVTANIGTTLAPAGAVVQGLGIGGPLNHAYIWDGATWNDAQDADIDAVSTLLGGMAVQVSTNQADIDQAAADLATLAVTAQDAYNQAYAADGRVSISDYEPGPDDIYQLDALGNPAVDGTGKPIFKKDGSMWITRTRDRQNLCTNPSFEVNTTDWAVGTNITSITRTAAAGALVADGGFVLRVVNNATVGVHTVRWIKAAYGTAVLEGQVVTMSGYARQHAGTAGAFTCGIEWLTAGGAVISTTTGPSVTLSTTAHARAYASGAAPATAVWARPIFNMPTASATWDLDAVLIEFSTRLGRYFDGGSEGGSWVGAVENSVSNLDGNAIIRLFTLEDSSWTEKFWTAETINSVNVSSLRSGIGYVRPPTLAATAMDGALLGDGTVAIDKIFVNSVVAYEAIAQGDLVCVTNIGGLALMRKARADMLDVEATHYTLAAVAVGDLGKAFKYGYNPYLVSATPGRAFLSATAPGKVTSAPPQEVGTVVQQVGTCVNGTTLNFDPAMPIAIV